MNISGPLSIGAVNPHQHDLDLRPFQRITAQVLSITGTTALLSIEGYPIVAQLGSAGQAAALLTQQTAQFIVTARTSQKLTLRMVGTDGPQANVTGLVRPGPEVAVRLLEGQNIPVTANHLTIVRAMLRKHLPVTPTLLNELSETLTAYGAWGSQEAELAAALKSAGLPVNAQSLALASRQAAQIGDSLARLIAKLSDMTGQDLPEELLKELDSNLQILNSIVLREGNDASELAEQLKRAAQILGTSLEYAVLERMQNPDAFPEHNLLSLARLQQALEQAGQHELADAIKDFLKDLQQNQFLNAKPESIPGRGEWAEISFATQSTQQRTGAPFSSARLRIARESGSSASQINPAYTRLVLQVDVQLGLTVEVDFSVVDRQIRTSVMAPDELWCQQAQEEFPTLEQALQDLGFTVKDTQIDVGQPRSFDRFETPGDSPLMTVDIEA